MESKVNPLRVVVKALLLYVVANVLFAIIQPPMGRVSLYNWLVTGRERFPFERTRGIGNTYSVSIFEDFDALFSSHVISGTPKKSDEYRVVLLGDSSVWGLGNEPDVTITEQLNQLGLHTCDGKQIRFYNLGYPGPFLLKDMLILERSLPYKPDMALWFVTLYSFTPTELEKDTFIAPHIQDVERLVQTYKLKDYARGFDRQTFWDKTIIGQRVRLKRNIELQFFAFLWQATGVDFQHEAVKPWKTDIPVNAVYLNRYNSADDWKSMKHSFASDVIDASHVVAKDTKLVFVNEPIYAADEAASPLRYNSFYPRWAYDLYREYLSGKMKDGGYAYVDMWNAIPNDEFSDDPFHLSPYGEQMYAEKLVPFILNYSCPKQ